MQVIEKDIKLSREYVWLEAWKVIATVSKSDDKRSLAIHADGCLREFDSRFNKEEVK